jgi:very-short-patch-repair endonuclease
MRLDELDRLARRNHGVVSREMSGLGASAWGRAIRSGTLVPIHPRVARLVGTADTPEQRIVAALFAAGPGVLASHRSAALLWGVARPVSDPVDIVIPDRRPVLLLDGVVIHRPRDHAHLSPPQRRSGIACTNILRTLCDLGAVDERGVVDAVGHALAARLVSLSALEAALIVHARPGRHGVRALRHAIGVWSIDGRPIDSLLERAMRRLVTDYRLPPVEFHVVIEGWEVDFRVTGTPVLIECDGWAAHGLDREQFERDRRRDVELAAAGWIVLRCSYRAITTDAARTAARIRAAIDRWTSAGSA